MAKNFPAPLKCVDCVAASAGMKFEDGLKFERENFLALMQTTESKALRHFFFGERAASKIPTCRKTRQAADQIGRDRRRRHHGRRHRDELRQCRHTGHVLEMKQEALDKGLATVRRNYENTMKKGKLTQAKFDERVGLIKGTCPTTTSRTPTS